jgi:ankyrin repeat protein
LHEASKHNHINIVRLLLAHGADVNASTKCVPALWSIFAFCFVGAHACRRWGASALHLSSMKNHVEIVQLLLRHSADVNALDNQ